MTGDLAISGALASTGTAAPYGVSAQPASAAGAPVAIASAAATGAPPPLNPALHIDAMLNLVVLQFFDAHGDVVNSIPSQKQLDAYRLDGYHNASGSKTVTTSTLS